MTRIEEGSMASAAIYLAKSRANTLPEEWHKLDTVQAADIDSLYDIVLSVYGCDYPEDCEALDQNTTLKGTPRQVTDMLLTVIEVEK